MGWRVWVFLKVLSCEGVFEPSFLEQALLLINRDTLSAGVLCRCDKWVVEPPLPGHQSLWHVTSARRGQKGPEGGRGLVTAASIHYLHPLPAHYLHLLTHTGRGHIAQCMTKVLSQIDSFWIIWSLSCECISIFPNVVFVDISLHPGWHISHWICLCFSPPGKCINIPVSITMWQFCGRRNWKSIYNKLKIFNKVTLTNQFWESGSSL